MSRASPAHEPRLSRSWQVRLAAIQLLAQLKRDAIVDHAATIVKRLEDSDADVRLTAMR